jgi:hypothetical protein
MDWTDKYAKQNIRLINGLKLLLQPNFYPHPYRLKGIAPDYNADPNCPQELHRRNFLIKTPQSNPQCFHRKSADEY